MCVIHLSMFESVFSFSIAVHVIDTFLSVGHLYVIPKRRKK